MLQCLFPAIRESNREGSYCTCLPRHETHCVIQNTFRVNLVQRQMLDYCNKLPDAVKVLHTYHGVGQFDRFSFILSTGWSRAAFTLGQMFSSNVDALSWDLTPHCYGLQGLMRRNKNDSEWRVNEACIKVSVPAVDQQMLDRC